MTTRLAMMLVLTAALATGCLRPRPFMYDRERVSVYLRNNPDVPGSVVTALMDGQVIKGMTQKEVMLCLGKPTKKETDTLYGATTEKWFYSRPVRESGGLERSRMWHKEVPLARVLFGRDGRVTHCQIFGRPPAPPPGADGSSMTTPGRPERSMSPMMPTHLEQYPTPPTWTAAETATMQRPGPAAPVPEPSAEGGTFDDWPPIALSGITSGGNTPTAIINRQIVSAGESVDGVKILEITPAGVLLQYKEDLQFLPMQQ